MKLIMLTNWISKNTLQKIQKRALEKGVQGNDKMVLSNILKYK